MPTSITLAFGNDLWETILMCRAIRYISYMETEKHSIIIEKERHGELESKALPPTYLSFLYPSALYILKREHPLHSVVCQWNVAKPRSTSRHSGVLSSNLVDPYLWREREFSCMCPGHLLRRCISITIEMCFQDSKKQSLLWQGLQRTFASESTFPCITCSDIKLGFHYPE